MQWNVYCMLYVQIRVKTDSTKLDRLQCSQNGWIGWATERIEIIYNIKWEFSPFFCSLFQILTKSDIYTRSYIELTPDCIDWNLDRNGYKNKKRNWLIREMRISKSSIWSVFNSKCTKTRANPLASREMHLPSGFIHCWNIIFIITVRRISFLSKSVYSRKNITSDA